MAPAASACCHTKVTGFPVMTMAGTLSPRRHCRCATTSIPGQVDIDHHAVIIRGAAMDKEVPRAAETTGGGASRVSRRLAVFSSMARATIPHNPCGLPGCA